MAQEERYFSEIFSQAAYSFDLRERKARTILAVFKDFRKTDLKKLKLLDVGSSTGAIAHCLAEEFGWVVGADVDVAAVDFARRTFRRSNLDFCLVDGAELAFRDNVFDAVICAHIYEHVPYAKRLMDEIYRVLKPGSICYFAADNRLWFREPHYGLPFLAWLPRPVSHLYLRLAGKGMVYRERLLTHRKLRQLVKKFSVIDYTSKVIKQPSRFCADYMLREGSVKYRLASLVAKYACWLCPGYIWLLQKEDASAQMWP